MISIKNHKKSETEFSLVLKIEFFYLELTLLDSMDCLSLQEEGGEILGIMVDNVYEPPRLRPNKIFFS